MISFCFDVWHSIWKNSEQKRTKKCALLNKLNSYKKTTIKNKEIRIIKTYIK